MVSIAALTLPILVAAAIVWLAAAVVWMVLPHHRTDLKPLTADNDILAIIERDKLTPGQYAFPNINYSKATAEEKAKYEKVPSGMLTVRRPGMAMGTPLLMYFIWLVIANVFIAYAAGVGLAPGTHYLTVFRVVGTIAILTYTAAQIPNSIWWGRPWSVTVKDIIDGAIFGLLTAGVYGWLWPK